MERDGKELRKLFRAGHPCVSIVTTEEAVAVEAARWASYELQRELFIWDCARGLRNGQVRDEAGRPETQEPVIALDEATRLEDVVIVLLDMAPRLDDHRHLRQFRDLLASARERRLSIVLVDHQAAGPEVVHSLAVEHELSLPDADEIESILKWVVRRADRETPGGVNAKISREDLRLLTKNLQGLRRRHVDMVISEIVHNDGKLTRDDLNHILASKRRLLGEGGLLEFIESPASLDDIGGMTNLKRWLGQRAGSMDPKAEAFGLTPPRGMLLLGVQGAGKSLCAKAVATAWGRPLLRMDPSTLYDRFIGGTEHRFREALSQAEAMSPVILWIDEIEKGFSSVSGSGSDGGLSRRVFGSLLTWMQDHEAPVFLVATANDIDSLPPELMRKGRFDEIFFVDLPTAGARRVIAEIHLRKRDRDPSRFDLEAIAQATRGYSGAEIEEAIKSAMHAAFSREGEIETRDVLEAVRASPPLSVTRRESIAQLRAWAEGRCVPADEAEPEALG
ncbi:MAG: AAA family ATPase [Planctomycetota bacterium]